MNTNPNQSSPINRPVINSITDLGFNVMVVYEPDGHLSYINVTDFQPSTSNSIESTDFTLVEGIDMDEFFYNTGSVMFKDNNANFANSIAAYLQKHPGRRRKYHKDVQYTLYLGK